MHLKPKFFFQIHSIGTRTVGTFHADSLLYPPANTIVFALALQVQFDRRAQTRGGSCVGASDYTAGASESLTGPPEF